MNRRSLWPFREWIVLLTGFDSNHVFIPHCLERQVHKKSARSPSWLCSAHELALYISFVRSFSATFLCKGTHHITFAKFSLECVMLVMISCDQPSQFSRVSEWVWAFIGGCQPSPSRNPRKLLGTCCFSTSLVIKLHKGTGVQRRTIHGPVFLGH